MKVLFFLPSLEGGGAEKTMLRIAKYMCDEQDSNVFLLLLNQSDTENHINAYNSIVDSRISIIDLKCPIEETTKFVMMQRLRRFVKKQNPDVIISTMLKSNVLISFSLLGTKYCRRLILRESCKRSVFSYSFFEKQIIKLSYNKLCKSVLALTEGVGKDIEETFSVKKDRIRVINNPVDINFVNNMSKEECCNISKHSIQFISIGRLHKVKDYPTIIEALSILKEENEYIDFGEWILGDGPEKETLLDKIEEKGLREHIDLLGFDTNPYKYLKNADALILSSLNEGFANVIIEAMALGVPVISSDCDFGPKEIITDELNGLLFTAGNARALADVMKRFINDVDLQKKLSDAGRRSANKYGISRIGAQYKAIFNDICQ